MIPFVDRYPTKNEIEQLRLILSTYQDGSGMLKRSQYTLPGWRDFERTVATTFNGQALESKWIYDIILNSVDGEKAYGISCKMRGTLVDVERKQRVTIELSNASGEFWDTIKKRNITQENYHQHAAIVGETIVHVVENWHHAVGLENDGTIDTSKSFFFVLQWEEKRRNYQLFQYPIELPDPQQLIWEVEGRRLIGRDHSGILFEWYGLSGGQLKYYPLAQNAIWQSDVFSLEPLPTNLEFGLQDKAKLYFPDQWSNVVKN